MDEFENKENMQKISDYAELDSKRYDKGFGDEN